MNRSRVTGDLASHGNIFVDIANDRVGIGSTIPGQKLSLPDNARIALGNSADTHLYHDGTLGHLQNNTGHFVNDISGSFYVRNLDGAKSRIIAKHNAEVELFHNGNMKLETAVYGVTVTGTTDTDGLVVSGVTTTNQLKFADSNGSSTNIALFGDSNDLKIYHNGSHSVVQDTGTGGLLLLGSFVELATGSGSEKYFRGVENGAAELYFNNELRLKTQVNHLELYGNSSESNIEFFTVSSGTNYVRGIIGVTNNGTMSFYTNGGTQKMAVNLVPSGAVELKHNATTKFATSATGIDVTGGAVFTSTDAGSSAEPEVVLYRNSASPADADYLGQIKFNGKSDTGAQRTYAKMTGKILDASNGTEDGIIEIAHIKAGSQTITGRWRSDSLQLLNSTNLSVNGTATFEGNVNLSGSNLVLGDSGGATDDRLTFGAGTDLSIYHDGSNSFVQHTGTGGLYLDALNNSADIVIRSQDNINMFTNSASQSAIDCVGNGGVLLYHQGNKKFETISHGIDVQGSVFCLGTTPQLRLNSDTSDGATTRAMFGMATASNNFVNGSTANDVILNCPKDFIISHGTTELMAQFKDDSSVELYCDSTKRFATTNTGFEGFGTEFKFSDAANTNVIINADTDNSNEAHHPSLSFKQDGTTQVLQIGVNGDTPTFTGGTHNFAYVQIGGHSNVGLEIATGSGGSQTKRLTITSSGHVLPNGNNTYDLGNSSNRFKDIFVASTVDLGDNGEIRLGDSDDTKIFHNGSKTRLVSTVQYDMDADIIDIHNAAANAMKARFLNSSVELYESNTKRFETTSTGFQGFGTEFKFSDAGDTNVIINADTDNNNESHHPSLSFKQDGSTHVLDIGVNGDTPDYTGGVHNNAYIRCGGHSNVGLEIATGPGGGSASVKRLTIDHNGHLKAGTDSAQDIGTNTTRWRNIYADTYYGDGSNLSNITSTTINNNANNRIITGSGTANTLEAESNLTFDNATVDLHGGQSSNSNYMVLRIEDTYHRKIQFAEATSAHAVGTYGGFIGYDAANNLTTIGTNHNSTAYNGITITREGGYVLNPTCPKFSAYMANQYSWNNQFIVYDSELYDIGSNYNTSNGKFTAPVTGYYVFGVKFRASVNFGQFGGMWTRNSSTYKRAFGQNSYAPGDCIVAVDVIPMSANDTMAIRFEGSHGGATGGAHENGFWGYLLG